MFEKLRVYGKKKKLQTQSKKLNLKNGFFFNELRCNFKDVNILSTCSSIGVV